MKLSQDIIFYHIKRLLNVRYICKITGLLVGRPVFYEENMSAPPCAVVIEKKALADLAEAGTLSGAGTVFVCLGVPDPSVNITGCSVISVTDISYHALFNILQEIYNLFDRWDEALRSCLAGGRFQDLIHCSETVVFDPICIVDAAFHYVAYCRRSIEKGLVAKYVDSHGNIPFDVVNELLIGNAYSRQCRKINVFSFSLDDIHLACKNLFYHNDYTGRLCVQMEKKDTVTLYYAPILEHLAKYMDRLYDTCASFNQNEIDRSSLRNILLNILNKEESTGDKLEKAVLENGWRKNDRYQLLQFRPNPRYDKNTYADYLAKEIESKWQGCVCFEFKNRLMLLVNKDRFSASDGLAFHQALAYFLRESLLVAGISRTVSAPDVCQAYEQTEAAIEFGVRETPTAWSFSFKDYALSYLLNKSKGDFEPEHICSEKLLTLKRHDEQKKNGYYKTLEAYFSCKFNASAAAKKLSIHRSSFLNRMDRIQKMVKINFDSTDELLYLAISFKILKEK